MYLLIEPQQFPPRLQGLAHLAVAAASRTSGLPIGPDGEIDGPVESGSHEVARAVDHLLNAVYSDAALPPELAMFLRELLKHLD